MYCEHNMISQNLLESLDHGIIYVNNNRQIIGSNSQGLSFLEELLGLEMEKNTFSPSDSVHHHGGDLEEWYSAALEGFPSQGTMIFETEDDEAQVNREGVLVKASPVYDDNKGIEGVSISTTNVGFFTDEIHTLEKLAAKDPLTNLYNRRAHEEFTKKELSQARRENYNTGIVMVDLDHLKSINDTMGHLKGDEALVIIAQYLTKYFREEDIVARYAGDEFIITATNIKKVDDFYQRVLSMVKDIGSGVVYDDFKTHPHSLSVSVGVYIVDNPNVSFSEVVKKADEALYKAKENGRSQAWYYDSQTTTSKKIE